MPLQIRRGTNAERSAMTQPLAAGELLYVTDTQRIYVGNGSTLGGLSVTGYTNEDAQDAVAPMFTGGTHTGITFTYNDDANTVNAVVSLANYNGAVKGDLTGSVFADTSTRIIDGTNGKINLDGTVNTSIIPDADSTYDLGSNTYKFRDLYLSGSSIHLGSALITSSGNVIDIPAGSTIGGVPFGSGGSDVSGNIIGDDSTVIVNTATKSITAAGGITGNLLGNVTGDVTGSVIGGGSLTLVNASTNTLSTTQLTINANKIAAGSNTIIVESSSSQGFAIHGITDGTLGADNASIEINGSKGTLSVPTNTVAGDFVSRITFGGYRESTATYQTMGSIVSGWNSNADFGDSSPESDMYFSVNNGLTSTYMRFSSAGSLYAPMFMAGSYAGSGLYPTIPSGVEGIIIFDSTTKKFKGYVLDTGLAGGGSSNSTPGWVDLN